MTILGALRGMWEIASELPASDDVGKCVATEASGVVEGEVATGYARTLTCCTQLHALDGLHAAHVRPHKVRLLLLMLQ